MSDDLISRKAVPEEILSFRCSITGLRAGKGVISHAAEEYRKSILRIIEEQPTAFDENNVIEKLKAEGCIIDDEAGNRAVESSRDGGSDGHKRQKKRR